MSDSDLGGRDDYDTLMRRHRSKRGSANLVMGTVLDVDTGISLNLRPNANESSSLATNSQLGTRTSNSHIDPIPSSTSTNNRTSAHSAGSAGARSLVGGAVGVGVEPSRSPSVRSNASVTSYGSAAS